MPVTELLFFLLMPALGAIVADVRMSELLPGRHRQFFLFIKSLALNFSYCLELQKQMSICTYFWQNPIISPDLKS